MTSLLPGFGSRRHEVSEEPPVPRIATTKATQGSEDVTAARSPAVASKRVQELIPVSGAMVDEAVEHVIRSQDLPPDLANVLCFNLSKDTSGAVAQQYYSSQAELKQVSTGISRDDLHISYALGDEDVAALNQYAPEYQIKYDSTDNHDHPMPAAMRKIDHRLVVSRVPYGVEFTDVGGNPLTYIEGSRSWIGSPDKAHVCGPVLDTKDPMRHTLRRMKASQVLRTTVNEASREMARRYLEMDPTFVCQKLAQDCCHKSRVLTSIHVYDIPLELWPAIMQKKSAVLVEGCLLFSPKLFESNVGELGPAKIRYEIDIAEDSFKMGFVGSPAWWYQHSWSEYIKYGKDQLLEHDGRVYSYKIVERRGDTVFFRVLRMDNKITPVSAFSTQRSPNVGMVDVKGFELTDSRSGSFVSPLRPKDYRFPRNLWYEMVSQASEDFERGVMDFNKMYNHYRTVSVRQTINAVLVMGGDPVSNDELIPLVVHACLAAAAQSLLGQRETRAITNHELRTRDMARQSTVEKVVATFSAVMNSGLSKLSPFKALRSVLAMRSVQEYEQWVLDWEPVVRDVLVPVSTLRSKVKGRSGSNDKEITAVEMFRDTAASTAAFDHFSAVVSNPKLVSVLTGVAPHIQTPSTESAREAGPETVATVSSTAPSTANPGIAELPSGPVQVARRAAIIEHMEEIKMQNRSNASTARGIYSDLTIRGQPNLACLRSRAELHRNPDLWQVRNGVILASALGIPASDFHHSAVYHPSADPFTNSSIRSVRKDVWKGVAKDGTPVENVNYTIIDQNFSGWVLVNDDFVVHNGPEILASMELSLSVPHDYTVIVHRAPPGSGKTYSIVHSVNPDGSDGVHCPVRESIQDTRGEIQKLHPSFPEIKVRVRTVDSYLTNHGSHEPTRTLRVDRLLADECFMTHSGKWYAAAGLLGVKEIHAYGDEKQIPHIPRVFAPKTYVKISGQKETWEWLTRRCPPSAVAAWGSVYDWKVRSLSENKISVMREVTDTKGMEVPKGCIMMCMYQADKVTLRKMYAHVKHKKILTAHEAEGKTYDTVWLHRFDNRKRTDKFSLFDQKAHVLVAMSRHRKDFVYVRPGMLGDLVSQWIASSHDSRRVAAAMDVASAGTTKEKM